eukprot:g2252.t1
MFAVSLRNDASVVAGNGERLWSLNANMTSVRWEYVTNRTSGEGGTIDDVVTYLESSSDALYIGTQSCLNVFRAATGTYERVSADEGLPFGNVSALLSHPTHDDVWIGTTRGLIWRSPSDEIQRWRFLNGSRWLSGNGVQSMARLNVSTIVVVHDDGAATWLQTQRDWDLQRKASHYEEILQRHDRHGLVAECVYDKNGSDCTLRDSDNDGLWTSLIVAAELFRYHVTREAEAAKRSHAYFQGIALLNKITAKKGFMARSVCSPEEWSAETCGGSRDVHDLEKWKKYTGNESALNGWYWKDDTSSDEVVGHAFALSLTYLLSPSSADRAEAREILLDIVGGIVKEGFNLVGTSGTPTTWGRWSPSDINKNRSYSDERGLQSLQIIAFLAAAENASASSTSSVFKSAFDELTNSSNQYDLNLVNLKITSPCDDNFSDDELAFLPFYTLLSVAESVSWMNTTTIERVETALSRTFGIARRERSPLWGAIYLATNPSVVGDDAADILQDIRWGLSTWPLSLRDWNVDNEMRQDIFLENGATRIRSVDTSHRMGPLPANERLQFRWNADPWDEGSNRGTGTVESDPGAWLLPYWMSRYYGFLRVRD